jgi:hypothetical protein
MPIAMKTFMTPEKMFGWMHGYHINWDQPVTGSGGVHQAAVTTACGQTMKGMVK